MGKYDVSDLFEVLIRIKEKQYYQDDVAKNDAVTASLEELRLLLDDSPEVANQGGPLYPITFAANFRDEISRIVVRMLVEHGADVTTRDAQGDTAFGNAVLKSSTDREHKFECAKYLLTVHDFPVETANDQRAHTRFNDLMSQPVPAEPEKKSGCYIATACYGSYDHSDVLIFRRFRDEVMLPKAFGRMLVSAYYKVSPPLAARLGHVKWLSSFLRRWFLEPLARKLR